MLLQKPLNKSREAFWKGQKYYYPFHTNFVWVRKGNTNIRATSSFCMYRLREQGEKQKLSKFLSDVLIAALPMAWIDGEFSSDERDVLEKCMQNSILLDQDKQRIREALVKRVSFDEILHSGLLHEEDSRKSKIKYRYLLAVTYQIAKADGVIGLEEVDLHNRIGKFANFREEEIDETRRLMLLESGIDIRDRIKILKGNIIEQKVDLIVNSTNQILLPHRKLGLPFLGFRNSRKIDEVIHRAAGNDLQKECKENKKCGVGEAKITKGYNLCQWIIHTVTPIWSEGNWEEQDLLRQCYRNSLMLASQKSIRTIAFPALGTGTGKVPLDQSARIAVTEVQQFLNRYLKIEQVKFVCWDEETYQAYIQAIEQIVGILPATSQLSREISASSPTALLSVTR